MTHHDDAATVDRDTIEILRSDQWTTITTPDPAQARWLWDQLCGYVFPQTGVEVTPVSWAIWKQPSKHRSYTARATYGREPDCPNCRAAGCPDEPHPEGCECDGHGVCRYWNAVPTGARAE